MNNWAHGALEKLNSCPVCDASTSKAVHYSRRDDNLNFPDTWHMHKCKFCRSIYLNPRPDDKSLPLAYQNYYTHASQEDETLLGEKFIQRLIGDYLQERFNFRTEKPLFGGRYLFKIMPPLKMQLDVYGRHIPKSMCHQNTKLLDFGCGSGSFLLRAQAMGIDVTGLEPDPAAVAVMKTKGLNVIQGDLQTLQSQAVIYDYITLNHVIEHVKSPKELLAGIHEILAPGGYIWLGLPNPNAFGISIFKKGWKGFHPPFHLIIPSQIVLSEWLKNAGFESITFIKRGSESKGLWREHEDISQREKVGPSKLLSKILKFFVDICSTSSTRYGEETIVIARKPRS